MGLRWERRLSGAWTTYAAVRGEADYDAHLQLGGHVLPCGARGIAARWPHHDALYARPQPGAGARSGDGLTCVLQCRERAMPRTRLLRQLTTTRTRPRFMIWPCGLSPCPSRCDVARNAGK